MIANQPTFHSRLDLRPRGERKGSVTQDDQLQASLPPPLDADGNEVQVPGNAGGQTRRSSRILDLHRLRHASVEERMDILRRNVSQPHHQQQQQQQEQQQHGSINGSDHEEGGHKTRLADRLRDKFRIHTRTQLADGASSPPSLRRPSS